MSKPDLRDYFASGYGRSGLFYLCVSPEFGGRLFIPNGHPPSLLDPMWRGNILKLLTVGQHIAVVFDDHSESPFILGLEPMQYELDDTARNQYPLPWFPFEAIGPDGRLHEWLCRWCNPREEKHWETLYLFQED